MKTAQVTLTAFAAFIIIAACSTSKKNTPPPVASAPAPTAPLVRVKPADGVYMPGEEELAAIQRQHPDATLDQLKQGYTIYADAECLGCHGAKNIYEYGTEQWKYIMDDMAEKARLTNAQKDAVYKYVLAIKAAKQL